MFPQALELILKFLQILIGEGFQIHQAIARPGEAANDFIELKLDRLRVAVLGILDEEDHQESDDRGPSVDDQLPGIGIMKDVAAQAPNNDNRNGAHERPGSSEDGGGFSCGNAEGVLDKAEEAPFVRFWSRFPIVGFGSDGNYWIALAARAACFPPNLFFRDLRARQE